MPVQGEDDSEVIKQFPAKNIIIIQPGSLFLRVGRAADLQPSRLLHSIARKRKADSNNVYKDSWLPPSCSLGSSLVSELEECRLSISHSLQSCVQSNGARRYVTPPQQISAYNRRSSPQRVSSALPRGSACTDTFVVGEKILELKPEDTYNIHFPYKRGDLNIHKGIGGSLSAILEDLKTIWSYAIETKLNIDLEDLSEYRCALLVPDIFSRRHIKGMVSLILDKLGFGECFLVQESVAAAFGAGLPHACVVDVGDQKTSISCIEDGMSHRSARLRMGYGVSDVCQSLAWLLRKSAFPYKEWNENIPTDAMLMRNLYRDFCHVDLDICGPQEKTFVSQKPGCDTFKFTLQVGDECIIAPLSMFYTDLLQITGEKSIVTQKTPTSDPEDPFDADYLRDTGRKRETAEVVGITDFNTTGDCNMDIQSSTNNDEDIVVDTLENVAGESSTLAPEQILGLDVAIIKCIERCSTEELKRKMYANILTVGGGVKLRGLSKWLQNKLALQIPAIYRTDIDNIVSSKDADPASTAWKGAAIMSCLESAEELWINQEEWKKYGVKVLRERAPFNW